MKTERKEKRNNMDLNEAVIILKESGYDMFNENYPIIICADMGTGKTIFIEKLNKEKPGSGYDLEVADIPGIWDEPDSEGNMALIDGWENIALDKIAELDAELTELFPKFYPHLRKQIEKYRPKTKEDWDRFAEFHDNMIKNMESVIPTEYKSEYFHFKIVNKEK